MTVHKVGQDVEAKLTGGPGIPSATPIAVHGMGPVSNTQVLIDTPVTIRIVHKQDIDGCCHPSVNWLLGACLCPELKRRTFNWVGENVRVRNWAYFCPMTHHLNCCVVEDLTRITLLDKAYAPYLERCNEPFGAVGLATQDDLCYCCCCIKCLCVHNMLLKPCVGECLFMAPCENGTLGFVMATRCLYPVLIPLDFCMADSASYRAALMQQVAISHGKDLTPRQLRAIGKSPPMAQPMER